MEIAIIRERQNRTFLQNLSNLVTERFQTFFNLTGSETETLLLPVVPEGLEFPKEAEITNLKGVTSFYNIPQKTDLQTFTINSFFPVNKNYSWANPNSNLNGYDYVDFFEERQSSGLPFRLLAYDINNNFLLDEIDAMADGISIETNGRALFRVHCDRYFLVKKFGYKVDKVKDIIYTLELKEYNEEITDHINWTQAILKSGTNLTVRTALKQSGLI